MKKFMDRLRGAQRGSDVLEESRLWRAGLIDRSPTPAPGGDSCMIWVSGGILLLLMGLGYPIIIAFFVSLLRFPFLIFTFAVLSTCPANITFVHWVQSWNRRVMLLTPSSKR